MKEQKFNTSHESLILYEVPEWFRDAKFGIFIHWGIYAVPAYGDEWYARHMIYGSWHWAHDVGLDTFTKDTIAEHHKKVYGDPKEFGYKDFIDIWNVDKFSADEWAETFEKAGAKYVMPVGIHHDSFALYDSKVQPWNSVNKGIGTDNHSWKTSDGHGVDFMAELQKACKSKGMHFGISNHEAENIWWMPKEEEYGLNVKRDDDDPYQLRLLYGSDMTEEEHAQRWYDIIIEMIDKYHPDITYFDGGLGHSCYNKVKREFAAHYYNSALEFNPDGVVFNYKGDIFEKGEAVIDVERGQLADIQEMPWQTDTVTATCSWGYVENDIYRSRDYCISTLCDIVSKNGNLLLNVSPKADGSLPDECKHLLSEIGEWMSTYGEAIYCTRPYKVFGEGNTKPGGALSDGNLAFKSDDIRYTTSKDGKYLYIMPLAKPENGKITVHTLKDKIANVVYLKDGTPCEFTHNGSEAVIDVSKENETIFAIRAEIVND